MRLAPPFLSPRVPTVWSGHMRRDYVLFQSCERRIMVLCRKFTKNEVRDHLLLGLTRGFPVRLHGIMACTEGCLNPETGGIGAIPLRDRPCKIRVYCTALSPVSLSLSPVSLSLSPVGTGLSPIFPVPCFAGIACFRRASVVRSMGVKIGPRCPFSAGRVPDKGKRHKLAVKEWAGRRCPDSVSRSVNR